MENSKNILDIKESVLKKFWVIKPHDENQIISIKDKYKIPDLIVRILMNRGVQSDNIEYLSFSTLSKSVFSSVICRTLFLWSISFNRN